MTFKEVFDKIVLKGKAPDSWDTLVIYPLINGTPYTTLKHEHPHKLGPYTHYVNGLVFARRSGKLYINFWTSENESVQFDMVVQLSDDLEHLDGCCLNCFALPNMYLSPKDATEMMQVRFEEMMDLLGDDFEWILPTPEELSNIQILGVNPINNRTGEGEVFVVDCNKG